MDSILKFEITTTLENKDYRKFLYTTTFLRNKWTVPLMALIACVCAAVFAWMEGGMPFPRFALIWFFLWAFSLFTVSFKVEQKYKKRVETDRAGTFNTTTVLKFYEDGLHIEVEAMRSSGNLKYDQIYRVYESKSFWMLYLNASQATLIRKCDVEDEMALTAFLKARFETRYKKI